MSYYVAVKIGCLECHIASDVLGVFESRASALAACEEYDDGEFRTEEDIKIFEVLSLNTLIAPRWEGYDTYYDLAQDSGYEYQLRESEG